MELRGLPGQRPEALDLPSTCPTHKCLALVDQQQMETNLYQSKSHLGCLLVSLTSLAVSSNSYHKFHKQYHQYYVIV